MAAAGFVRGGAAGIGGCEGWGRAVDVSSRCGRGVTREAGLLGDGALTPWLSLPRSAEPERQLSRFYWDGRTAGRWGNVEGVPPSHRPTGIRRVPWRDSPRRSGTSAKSGAQHSPTRQSAFVAQHSPIMPLASRRQVASTPASTRSDGCVTSLDGAAASTSCQKPQDTRVRWRAPHRRE